MKEKKNVNFAFFNDVLRTVNMFGGMYA
jgi:hypothetical protein